MKRLLMAVLTVTALGLGGCTQALTGRDAGGGELEIRISARDFGPDAGQGRAVETGYTTGFEAGDEIGITAISGGAIVPGQDNLRYRFDGQAWESESPRNWVKLVPGAAYFVYYPYDGGNGGKLPDAIKDGFTPKADQSARENYTASDLMTWSGAANEGERKLNITLVHALSLVEVTLPAETSGAGIKVGAAEAVTPYNVPGGTTYRCIVKPGDSVNLSGIFTYRAQTVTWQQTADLKPGQYVKITVTNEQSGG